MGIIESEQVENESYYSGSRRNAHLMMMKDIRMSRMKKAQLSRQSLKSVNIARLFFPKQSAKKNEWICDANKIGYKVSGVEEKYGAFVVSSTVKLTRSLG